jgi:hypothetical protein
MIDRFLIGKRNWCWFFFPFFCVRIFFFGYEKKKVFAEIFFFTTKSYQLSIQAL